MVRLTLQDVYTEVSLIKNDIKHIRENQKKMCIDVSAIKETLLNPNTGTISKVNKNTSFRNTATKALWSVWIVIIGIIAKLIFWD